MSTNTLNAIFFVCAAVTGCFYLWLQHDKEMNGHCTDCSECVERWQQNINIGKE